MSSELHIEFQRLFALMSESKMERDNHDWMKEFNPELSMEEKIDSEVKDSPFRKRLMDEFFGYGPLNPFFLDCEVSEILVNSKDDLLLEKNGQLSKIKDHFLSDWSYQRFVKAILDEGCHKLDLENPFASFLWKDFRIHMVHPPLNPKGFSISMRRLRHDRPLTIEDLRTKEWASADSIDILMKGVKLRKNILVVGPTGSGKTTVLSSMIHHLPATERVVILEDTDEILIPNPASTKLLTRSPSEKLKAFGLGDLVKESLRMRPDRLVIGEIRGGEACDLLMALATGHGGSLATLHASDPKECLLRLEMLIQMGAPHWSLDSIRKLIQLTVDWIVVVEKKEGRRRLKGIYQISSLEANGFLIDPVETLTLNDRERYPLENTSCLLPLNRGWSRPQALSLQP